MAGERLRVGVVGVGYLGSIHARIYAKMPDVELVGVVDIDAERAAGVAAEVASVACRSADELLGLVDAVSVVVPTTAHRQVATPFIEHGVHVLLEKPIASTVSDAEAIVQLAEAHGVVLQIGHLERFNAGVMALAEQARQPRFIEVHRLGTFVERATDVDVITDLMIHDIDIVLSLVRSELKSISAVGIPVVTEHVDIANARLVFNNGAVANVTASRVSNKRFRRIRVFADARYLALNFQDQQLDVVTTASPAPNQRFPEIVSERINVTPRPPLDAELAHFVDVVRRGARPLVSGYDGLAALKVAEQVKREVEVSLAG